MSINTTRETVRLASTNSAIQKQEGIIKALEAQLEVFKPEHDKLTVKEAEYQAAVQVYGDLAVEAITILAERNAITVILNKEIPINAQILVATRELLAFEARRDQQKEALEKQTFLYPTRLKRHLRRCKKFGWTDSRLGVKRG